MAHSYIKVWQKDNKGLLNISFDNLIKKDERNADISVDKFFFFFCWVERQHLWALASPSSNHEEWTISGLH